jgi:hypothetical protein
MVGVFFLVCGRCFAAEILKAEWVRDVPLAGCINLKGCVMCPDTIYKRSEDVTHQDMGADQPTVILRLSDGQLYTCNRTTRLFLEQVDGSRTLRQIAEELHQGFEVGFETLLADLSALAQTLCDDQLISRV